MPNPNLLVWTSDIHMVSGDFEVGILGRTTPTEADTFASYLINTLDPVGVVDTGDAKDHYGADTGDEQDNFVDHVLDAWPWLPVNSGFNATAPTLPGNHDEISDYDTGTMPTGTDFSLWNARLWGPPYHWTADWDAPQIRFIGIHSYIHHSQDGYKGFFHCDEADWLEDELAALPDNWQAIVCSHGPANHDFGAEIRPEFGGNELLTVLETYSDRVSAYLCGHRHSANANALLSGIIHITGGATSYTFGNSAGAYMPITYDPDDRTLTVDCLYFRGSNIHTRVGGYDPIVIDLPGLADNVPPVATFTTTPNTGTPVNFDASESVDPDQGGIVSYEWDFGDGETSDVAVVTHIYAEPGTYTVVLTVTDNRGGVDTFEQEVTAAALSTEGNKYFYVRLDQ